MERVSAWEDPHERVLLHLIHADAAVVSVIVLQLRLDEAVNQLL